MRMSKQKKKGLVPVLRFPEFRDKGEWENTQLGKLGDFTGGGTPTKSNDSYWQGNIPWISSSDIYEDSIHEFDISRYISEEALKDSATKLVPENSVLLVSRVGVGKLAISKNSVCTSQDFTNFTPAKDDLVFLGYYLKSRNKALLEYSQGMAIKGFTKDDVSKLDVYIPSLGEQQEIADCLTSVDELITAQSQKLDAFKAHKKGLRKQLFPAEGETLPKLRFPEFRDKGEWVEKTLGDICDMQAGKFVRASDIKEEMADGLNPCFGGNGLRGYTKTFTHSGKYSLIGRQGALCGNVTLTVGQFHATEHAVVVTPNEGVSSLWLYYVLNHLNLNRFATGQAQPGLSVENLNKVELKVASEEDEQQKIADCLTSVDELITAQTQKLDALKAHKKGLMQQLFPDMNEVGA